MAAGRNVCACALRSPAGCGVAPQQHSRRVNQHHGAASQCRRLASGHLPRGASPVSEAGGLCLRLCYR